ncbi:hypothetical protein FS837_001087 [Tulasnella sp. UAMH 9824]|nr:hypothetical protein FS837_001087 [Tulasnella sp. UAMH 9824]
MSASSSNSADPSPSTPTSAPAHNSSVPPKNAPRNPPKLSVQSAVPPVMQVTVPQGIDVPFRSCFIWRQWSTRTELMKHEIHSTVCWRKIAAEPSNPPPRFPTVLPPPPPTLVIGDLPATQSQRVPARRTPTEQQQDSSQGTPQERLKELPLLKARMIEYHSHADTPIRTATQQPVTLRVRSYPDGGFRGIEISDPGPTPYVQDFRETVLGYEFYDNLGGYHFYMPIGLIHHRIYQSVAHHFDRAYGPTVRLLNKTSDRIQTSYTSGKQFEAWGIIWNRMTSAEGLKLWGRMLDKARTITSRSKNDDDEKPGSER